MATRNRFCGALMLALAAALIPSAAHACGTTQVCGDLATTLHGQVISEGIVLTWSSDDEDSSIGGYHLWRYNCSSPGTCATPVALIPRSGSCASEEPYTYTDTPATPYEQWSYFVDVRRADGSVACTESVTPE